MKLLSLFLFLCVAPANAQESFFQKENFKIAVGAEYLSQLSKRGIVTYGSWQAIPIYAVSLWNPNLELVGSTLNYKFFLNDKLKVRSRINMSATNDRPLYYTSEKQQDRVRRTSTAEGDVYLEWNDSLKGSLSLMASQDLSVHKSTYLEFVPKLVLWNALFRGKELPHLQLSAFGALGFGFSKHNRYLYGSGASRGFTHYEYGISVASPAVIDDFYPVLKITRSGLMKDTRSGSFVREKSHWQVIALAAFRIF